MATQSNESYLASFLNRFLASEGFSGQNLLVTESAFLGNIQAESGFRTTALAVNDGGPGVNAHGFVQWEGGRYTNLLNFAKSSGGDATSAATQAQFIGYELTHGYSSVLASLKGVTNVDQAAQIVQAHYEVSSPDTLGKRQGFASTIYSQLVAGQPLTGGGSTAATTVSVGGGGGGVGIGSGISVPLPGPLGTITNDIFGFSTGGLIGNNPLNTILGSTGASIGGIAKGLFAPLEKWVVNAFLIVTGVIIVVVAIVLLAKDDDAQAPDSTVTTPTKGGGIEHEAEDHPEAALAE